MEGLSVSAEEEAMERSGDRPEAPPVDHGGAVGTGKMVVVGLRMDPQSRELLTWALVKVAEPGDCVIALHILLGAADRSNRGGTFGSCSSLISLVNSFQSMLDVYDGFCHLKQIDLKLKVCRGASLRKSLVRETSNLPAAKLILGVAKNNRALGSSTSVARYCAKKLSLDCAVMAVNNGKIVFQREEAPAFTCLSPAGWLHYPPHSRRLSRRRHLPRLHSGIASVSYCKVAGEAGKNRTNEPYRSSDCAGIPSSSPAPRGRGKKGRSLSLPGDIDRYEICSSAGGDASSCYDGSSISSRCDVESNTESPHGGGELSSPLAEEEEGSTCATENEVPRESRPGWPRLRRAVPVAGSEKFMISTFQRALRLPLRQSASSSTVHPDRKPLKPLANWRTNAVDDGGLPSPAGRASSPAYSGPAEEKPRRAPKDLENLYLKYSSTCRLFSYQELADAALNFSAERLVGRGGSSQVYRGRLLDGEEFAVKTLKPSEDALRQFLMEIEIITTLRHKNIISLTGFCFENENLVLVYDFQPRGSLEDNLHGNEREKASFGWAQRFKVAIGVAEALDYLHGGRKPVIHRDVKSSNILLSDDYEPRLADFGLAQWEESSSSSPAACSDVAGTFGYLAPEYFISGKVDEKIDVYAFGVVLLELLSGRKPINAVSPKRQQSLVTWAKQFLADNQATRLLDPSLEDQYDEHEVERTILAASLCIRRAPRSRPTMALVLKLLQGDEDIVKWAKVQESSSEEGGVLDEEEPTPTATIRSHLSLALLDVDDEFMSLNGAEDAVDFIMARGSLEDYFQSRENRSSSCDSPLKAASHERTPSLKNEA